MVARTIAAPRERVFRAWIDPAAVKRWFFDPSKGSWRSDPQIDARVGGRYRFEGEVGGAPFLIEGEYREIRAPERLVFTWRWNIEPGLSEETVVTVEFLDRDGSTEVRVRHEGFVAETDRQEHEGGWRECLDAIARELR
jgi:uncharacterized protein YndB with AHSA1/START domain